MGAVARQAPPQPGRPISTQPGRPISPQPGRPISPKPGRPISPQPGRPISPQPGRPIGRPLFWPNGIPGSDDYRDPILPGNPPDDPAIWPPFVPPTSPPPGPPTSPSPGPRWPLVGVFGRIVINAGEVGPAMGGVINAGEVGVKNVREVGPATGGSEDPFTPHKPLGVTLPETLPGLPGLDISEPRRPWCGTEYIWTGPKPPKFWLILRPR